jgi:ATP-dependent exoDNAse (exonuclease V) beta subunit
MELAATYDLDCSRDLIVFSREVLTNSIHQALAGILDFNDQIYMPTLFGAAFPTFDIIMVDEAQDLSQLQHEMLAQLLHNKSRIIAVGDTHQAIYGFRGALNNSMTRLQSQFNLRKLPLTISYRCPKSVVREAQTVVSHIESHPDAPEGRVGISGGISVMDFPVGSAILCRNNAPLVSLAWLFIRASIPVTFLGKDLGKKLEKLVKKLAKTDVPIDILEHNLGKWAAREIAKQPRREASIQDQVDTLRSLFADCLSSKQVLAKITAIFEQTTGGRITLASIHTSKGFEWPTVYFLNDYLIPSKYAKQDWQLEQEDNLRYVAITRAQETLLYLDTKDVY